MFIRQHISYFFSCLHFNLCFQVSQVLKRASSVPTRVPEVVQFMHRHEKTQSQQDSVDTVPANSAPVTLTPSTTEESVNTACQGASSREPLLYNSSNSSNQATGSSQTPEDEYKQHNSVQPLPKLPGVIPLSGHNGPSGWL